MVRSMKVAMICIVAVVSLLAVVVGGKVSGQSSREKDKDAEVQWEYMVVSGGNINLSGVSDLSRKQPDNAFAGEASVLQRNLDKLGQKGWELVTVHGSPAQPVFYLKRQKEVR